MNSKYLKPGAAMVVAVMITASACGQNHKVKTITIVNGDTTITEKVIGDKEIEEIERNITMVITEDGGKSEKVVKKKIIINEGDEKRTDAMAYAYSMNEGDGKDIEITTDENGKETRIIIKKEDNNRSAIPEKKAITHPAASNERIEKDKVKMMLNIKVEKNLAKLEVETGSNEPLNLSLLNENGKQVFYETQKNGSKFTKEIRLEKGTYFLNLIQNKKSTSEKIIIE